MPPPLRKRVKRTLRAWVLRALVALVGLLPLGLSRALGRRLGALGWRVARRERRLAEDHVRLAFPGAGEDFVRATVRRTFVNLGEHAFELCGVSRIDRDPDAYVELAEADRRVFLDGLAEGRGLIVVTGHVGNWELAARYLARLFEVVAIARPLHDAGLQRLVDAFRDSGGVVTLNRGARDTPRRMLRQFKRGGSLFLLVDQDTDAPSLFVPFLGRPAKTPRAPADLALRTGAAVVVGFIHRTGPGGRHRITARRIEVTRSGDREADARELTARLNLEIEGEIRAHPADWVWFHRRWRSRPEVETAAAGEAREGGTAPGEAPESGTAPGERRPGAGRPPGERPPKRQARGITRTRRRSPKGSG